MKRLVVGIALALMCLLCPIKAHAQALPELTAQTIAEFEVLHGQAGDLAFQMNGVNLPNGANSLLILNGIYRTMQAFNEWAGGDDYQVTKEYYLERSNMPEWLAQYSGDYVFWEISYFGDKITMITDPSGDIVLTPAGNKALNVAIGENMDTAVKLYKQSNNNSVEDLPVPKGDPDVMEIAGMGKPYITGKELHFYVYINGVEHRIMMNDFTQCLIGCGSTKSQWGQAVYSPCFAKLQGSSNQNNIIFYDETTHTTLETFSPGYASVPDRGSTVFSIYSYKMSEAVLPGNYGTAESPANYKYFLPATYRPWGSVNPSIYMYWNNGDPYINGYAYNGAFEPALYNNTIQAFYLDIANGQEITGGTSKLPVVGEPLSAQSIETIQDAIAEIEPEIDPVTGIEILPIPSEFPLPEAVPLEITPEAPIIPPGIEDFPSSDPEIVPPYDPSVDPSAEQDPESPDLPQSEADITPLENIPVVTGLQNRFPFSIPWDIYNAFSMLQAEREAPSWEWTMQVSLPGGGTFEHTFYLNLEAIDPLVTLFRDLFLLAFILGLAVFSYNKFFGGGA